MVLIPLLRRSHSRPSDLFYDYSFGGFFHWLCFSPPSCRSLGWYPGSDPGSDRVCIRISPCSLPTYLACRFSVRLVVLAYRPCQPRPAGEALDAGFYFVTTWLCFNKSKSSSFALLNFRKDLFQRASKSMFIKYGNNAAAIIQPRHSAPRLVMRDRTLRQTEKLRQPHLRQASAFASISQGIHVHLLSIFEPIIRFVIDKRNNYYDASVARFMPQRNIES